VFIERKYFFFGLDAKTRRVYSVVFRASLLSLPGKMGMFTESRLMPFELDNNQFNRSALKKLLLEMEKFKEV
jgi:hypothetical protein